MPEPARPDPARRRFFREALAEVIRPVADWLEAGTDAEPSPRRRLRPPGAVDEDHFADTCRRCHACVDVCPAQAIVALGSDAGDAAGTPVVDPERAACVVCDGLKCTHVCPSGALTALSDPRRIRMGTARVHAPRCVRSAGSPCTECVDRCPLGPSALRFDDEGPPVVLPDGCVGCGVCEMVCPTSPKAIVAEPR